MAVFFPAGIPPLTAAEQNNKVRYLEVFQGHSPEALLRDPLLLPFPTPQFFDYPHDPQGPEESLRQWEAKRLNVKLNLHELLPHWDAHPRGHRAALRAPEQLPPPGGRHHRPAPRGRGAAHRPGHAHAFLDDSDDCLIYNLLFPLQPRRVPPDLPAAVRQ